MNHCARNVLSFLVCVGLTVVPAGATQTSKSRRPSPTPRPDAPGPENQAQAKVVAYGDRDVVRIKTKVRFTTLIVLPRDEAILDFVCGDKDLWIVNGTQNFAYVKPAKEGSQTNLNLITASGNIYSFVLVEVSETAESAPDLKVFIETKDAAMVAAASAPPRLASTRELEDYRQQVELAKDETRQVKESAESQIEAGIDRFVKNVRFAYRFEAGKKPFYVRAMYHDDRFTWIQARPEETPTLYELKDKKPNLVNFQYQNGVYVVDKILDEGYLAIGNQKLRFTRAE